MFNPFPACYIYDPNSAFVPAAECQTYVGPCKQTFGTLQRKEHWGREPGGEASSKRLEQQTCLYHPSLSTTQYPLPSLAFYFFKKTLSDVTYTCGFFY